MSGDQELSTKRQEVIFEVKSISKAFPGVQALDNVSFSLRAGTVHALCGENGAGKSTLMKIINGLHQPDAGHMVLDGEQIRITHPVEARDLGIAMVPQELDYVPGFTVAQSLFLGVEPRKRLGGIDWAAIKSRTRELLEQEDVSYQANTRLSDLSVSDIQMLEIIKAVSFGAKIVLFDEPTSAITENEVEALFDKIQNLKSRGVGIIYVSHKLSEVFRVSEEISVLRDGKLVDTKATSETNTNEVVKSMVGRELSNVYPSTEGRNIGETVLKTTGLSHYERFSEVDINVRSGEIVGLAGLVGAGRTELAEAIAGIEPASRGSILVNGEAVEIRDVSDSIRNGIALVAEDRKRLGLITVRDIKENVSLASLDLFFQNGRNKRSKEVSMVEQVTRKLNVKAPSISTRVEALSGGNQQKVVLAKWLLRDSQVLLLDEPTRGIDVGAKFEIYKWIVELAAQGKAILMISSEMPELLGLADRIYVMSKGHVTGELKRDEFSQESIMNMATMAFNR